MIYCIALLCVTGIAVGPILFKLSARWLQYTGSLFNPHTLLSLVTAFAVHAMTSLVWVWLSQKTDLGRIHPLMALAFIVVPIGSHYFFDEYFPTQYSAGIVCIVVGIMTAIKS